MNRKNWQDITYLRYGNSYQQRAYQALKDLRIFEILADYSPVLAGTIPLGISLPGSDLDILCEAYDLAGFQARITQAFGQFRDFHIKKKEIKGTSSIVARFVFEEFPVEIFGQAKPVEEQHAYRHMVIEARLLEIGRTEACKEIRRMKRQGLKTEPAFARYFNLPNDPYETLLRLYSLSKEELKSLLAR